MTDTYTSVAQPKFAEISEVNKEIEELTVEGEKQTEIVSLGVFHITHYCPCMECCGKTDGITASGTKAEEGRTIAVDPDIIPLGSEVVINGHTYIAEDIGGLIDGNRIDVYVSSHERAWDLGVYEAEVLVKE